MPGAGLEGRKETRGQIPGVSRRAGCRQGRTERWAVYQKAREKLMGSIPGPREEMGRAGGEGEGRRAS